MEYEFRLSARNGVDYGDVTTSTIRTPDGSESRVIKMAATTLGRELLPAAAGHSEISAYVVSLNPLFSRALSFRYAI